MEEKLTSSAPQALSSTRYGKADLATRCSSPARPKTLTVRFPGVLFGATQSQRGRSRNSSRKGTCRESFLDGIPLDVVGLDHQLARVVNGGKGRLHLILGWSPRWPIKRHILDLDLGWAGQGGLQRG
jgi:hypothetical protein